jgi:hypothetical protein
MPTLQVPSNRRVGIAHQFQIFRLLEFVISIQFLNWLSCRFDLIYGLRTDYLSNG